MHGMVDEALGILTDRDRTIEDFGRLLDEAWRYKRSLSARVSTPHIDNIYDTALRAGALGGKLLGAGGGGFLLLFARPSQQDAIRQALQNLIYVPFKFDNTGSSVAVYQPAGL